MIARWLAEPHVAAWWGEKDEELESIRDHMDSISVEPLIGPVDACDFAGMDWILIGGESGPRCRDMKPMWLEAAIAKAQSAGAAIWFKQYGHERNNPYVQSIMASQGKTQREGFARAVADGLELAVEEKGGATVCGCTYRQLPQAWHALRDGRLTM